MRSATLVALFFMAVGITAEPAFAGPTGTTSVRGQSVVRSGVPGRASRAAPRARTRVVQRTPPRPPPPRWYGSRSDTIRTPAYVPARPTRTVRAPARYVPPPPPPPPLHRTARPTTRVVRSHTAPTQTPRTIYRAPAPRTTYRAPAPTGWTQPATRTPPTATITYARPAPSRLITRPSRTSTAGCNDKSPRKFLTGMLPKSSCKT